MGCGEPGDGPVKENLGGGGGGRSGHLGGGEQRNGETVGSLRAGGAQRPQTGKGRGRGSPSTLRRRRKHLSPTCLAGE